MDPEIQYEKAMDKLDSKYMKSEEMTPEDYDWECIQLLKKYFPEEYGKSLTLP